MCNAKGWGVNEKPPKTAKNSSSGYSVLPVNKKELYPRTSFSSPPSPLAPLPSREEGEWNRGSAARSSAHWPVLAFLCWQERQHGSVETRAGERRRERERGGSVCWRSGAGGRQLRDGERQRERERRRLAVC